MFAARGETTMSVLKRFWLGSLAATALWTVLGCSTSEPGTGNVSSANKPNAGTPATPRVPFTISKETTYITEPLRADGYPDYVAAWNQQMSQGMTPENNAAVLFWKAMGPGAIPKEGRDKFFQMLGIPSLPETGDYCTNSDGTGYAFKDAREHANAQPVDGDYSLSGEQERKAMTRPWSKDEFPAFAEWLEVNQKPLDMIVEASERTRHYQPWVRVGTPDPASPLDGRMTGVGQYRNCVRWLCKRAMLRLNDHEFDKAWADILTCHRLARAAGLYSLVAATVESMTVEVEKNILQRIDLTAEQVAKMRSDLSRLSPMPKMGDVVDADFRIELLESVTAVARDGADARFAKNEPSIAKMLRSWNDAAHAASIDWDSVLRMVNSRCDKAVSALRKGTRADRKQAIAEIVDDDIGKLLAAAATTSPEARSNLLGRAFLVELTAHTTLMPLADVDDRSTVRSDLIGLAFALAAYHADHGSYPSQLADLKPKYVSEVPKDVFSDTDLHYTSSGDGYLLYSVGVDGKDEGGKAQGEWTGDHISDDLVIRVPAKP
jgi:hypothetical protein